MKERDLKFVTMNISELKEAEYNPRHLTDQERAGLKKSLQSKGFVKPLIVNRNKKRMNILIDGHQRLSVLRELGVERVDCITVDCTEAEEKQVNISLNKNLGSWDWEKLVKWFPVEELQELGFTKVELRPYLNSGVNSKDDEIPEPQPVAVTRLGDLWVLGDHRLMCGDSTNLDSVGELMDGKKADMVFTDPPYNVDYGANKKHPSHKIRSIKNDAMVDGDWDNFVRKYISTIFHFCDGYIYISMSDKELGHMQRVFVELGGKWASFIIWVKDRLVLSPKDYHSRHESILFGWKDGVKSRLRVKDRTQDDVWEIKRPSDSKEHPTMKPVELVERAVMNSSEE